jgi:hypothetical protein
MRAIRSQVIRAVLWGALLVPGFLVVGYWGGTGSATLLVWWLPLLYGLATLMTGRREIVEQLRADALWFTVSRPKSYEHGFGYGRVFEWAEESVRAHARQDYSKETQYYFDVGSGLSWFSGDAVGQSLDYNIGIRTNVVELGTEEAQRLSAACREYELATGKCYVFFAMGWVLVVVISVFLTFQQILLALGVAVWIVIAWGILPKRTLRDRTQDAEFLCRHHIHVYTYFPGDDEIGACYHCVCGKTEQARDDSDKETW